MKTDSQRLVDGHGRPIGDLRISVTDRCNFRCIYCMPEEGLPWFDRAELLRYEEIARLVAIMCDMGVNDVRLTGGEPLVRRELHHLIALIDRLGAVSDLSLTTNGYLLKKQLADLVTAGLRRINVSLDTLSKDRFFRLTRRDSLATVLEGLKEAERYPQLAPIKVNVVSLNDLSDEEIREFAALARRKPYIVRFIEYMPLDADRSWRPSSLRPNDSVRKVIEAVHPLEPLKSSPHETAERYRFADGKGEIGFISPVTRPFCSTCNRIRLTADGKLRTCLFSHYETDLRGPLRDGASDGELAQIIREAVWRKEMKHAIGEQGFRQPARSMSRIGG